MLLKLYSTFGPDPTPSSSTSGADGPNEGNLGPDDAYGFDESDA